MNDPYPPRRLGRGGLLAALLVGALLLVLIAIYVGGFAYQRDLLTFGERRMTFTWADQDLAAGLAGLFPGQEIRVAEDCPGAVMTFKVEDMRERDVMQKISDSCAYRIRQIDGVIMVEERSWLARAYASMDDWMKQRLGSSPWR